MYAPEVGGDQNCSTLLSSTLRASVACTAIISRLYDALYQQHRAESNRTKVLAELLQCNHGRLHHLNDFSRVSFPSTRSRGGDPGSGAAKKEQRRTASRGGDLTLKLSQAPDFSAAVKKASAHRAAASRPNAPRQDLVDAAAIEIDDLEAPALVGEAFADGRQVP